MAQQIFVVRSLNDWLQSHGCRRNGYVVGTMSASFFAMLPRQRDRDCDDGWNKEADSAGEVLGHG